MKIPLRTLPLLCVLSSAAAQEIDSPGGTGNRDHVVIILDASGSMRQPMPGSSLDKMTAAKAALREVLGTVPETTHIGLLVFSARNLSDPWAYPLGPRREQQLMAAIDLPAPYGGTPLGEYMKIGADRLLEARAEQYGYGTYRLLIVTDGEATDDRLVRNYGVDILSRGVLMDVIGVDMKAEHTLAAMAHSYRSADDPESLVRAIRETFAEVSGDEGSLSMEESFDLIGPLPAAMAESMLQALSVSGNEPIGVVRNRTEPPPRQTPNTRSPAPSGPAPQPPPGDEPGTWRGNFFKILPILALVALVMAIRRRRS